MTDEEKKAIEFVKSELQDEKIARNDYQSLTGLYGNLEIETVLNIIEKQSKEIEHQIEKRANQKKELAILNAKQVEFNKLVNTLNSYKGQFKRQQKEIEELKDEYNTKLLSNAGIYQLGFKDGKDSVKNKIKAKIEEYDDKGMTVNLANRSAGKTFQQAVHYEVKKVLQSLLEKE